MTRPDTFFSLLWSCETKETLLALSLLDGLISDQASIWSRMKALDDETQLTLAACKGSVEAFEALVLHYEPRIRRMLYSLTQDRQLTQDLCQETFLAAYRALPRMKGLRFETSCVIRSDGKRII